MDAKVTEAEETKLCVGWKNVPFCTIPVGYGHDFTHHVFSKRSETEICII
jgi:hypothetical protein